MGENADRLKQIQAQLDVLLEEVRRLRASIDAEGRRRTHAFPFEPSRSPDPQRRDKPRKVSRTH